MLKVGLHIQSLLSSSRTFHVGFQMRHIKSLTLELLQTKFCIKSNSLRNVVISREIKQNLRKLKRHNVQYALILKIN